MALMPWSVARSTVNQIKKAMAAALREAMPPLRLLVSEWADKYRRLALGTTAHPGQWETERAEYQREMMDAVVDPNVEMVVLKTAARVGKTAGVILNAIGYFIHHDPSPILVVFPNDELGESWSKDDLASMISESPVLRGKVSEAKSRDSANTIGHKKFKGGNITIASAMSPTSLSGRNKRIVICDEVDRFPTSSGTEGDPVRLAMRRADNFWNRKYIFASTPKHKGSSRISKAYDLSDQRTYEVPCPHCQKFQTLRWRMDDDETPGGMVWDRDAAGRPIAASAAYECAHCHILIEEKDKAEMVARGKWRAKYPARKIRGYHINALYSPWRTWEEIVTEWYEVVKFPEQLQVFVNTVLGEEWEDKNAGVEPDFIKARLEDYDAEVPSGVGVLIGAIDVQLDRLEVAVFGYGADEEQWLIHHEQVWGNPGQNGVWLEADAILKRAYVNVVGRKCYVHMAFVDSGGDFTEEAYAFTRTRADRRIFAIKGAGGAREIVGKPTISERYKARLFIVGVDTAKDAVMARLSIRRRTNASGEFMATPGFVHLALWTTDEYIDGLTAEKKLPRVKANRGLVRVWVKQRANEPFDLTVYAYCALKLLGDGFIARLPEMAAALLVPPATEEETKAIERARRPAKSWATDF